MNTTDDNRTDHTPTGTSTAGPNTDTSTSAGVDMAVARAEAGTAGWEDAVRLQRWATPQHSDFYALAGELVATLNAVDDLTQVLDRQVTGYGAGRRLYDDTRQIDPYQRLEIAATALEELRSTCVAAAAWANAFWSAIGHIGIDDSDTDDGEPGTAAEDSDGGVAR